MDISIKSRLKNQRVKLLRYYLLSFIILIFGILISVFHNLEGSLVENLREIIYSFDKKNMKHLIIVDYRIPRVLSSALVGAALAISGAIMQGITKNPLADSGLMGLNAGSAFALAISFSFFPKNSFNFVIIFAFAGAMLAAILVNGIASTYKGQESSLKLVLAGAAINMMFLALSQGIAMYFEVSQNLVFWSIGAVSNVNWHQLEILFIWLTFGIILSLFLGKYINILNLGDEIARGLGLRVEVIYILSTIAVLILAGSSVAVVGPIAFVGLIIPHIVRNMVSRSYKHIIPFSGLLGGLLLVFADFGAKNLNPPFETPLGAIISLIGAPFLLYLIRRERSK